MCKAIDDVRKETRAEMAMMLIIRGKETLEEIAEDSGLTLEEVQELAAEVQTTA